MKKVNLSKGALKVFEFGLPSVLAVLVYCCITLFGRDTYDLARCYIQTCSMLEHIMMSLLLIVGGALLFDLEVRKYQS